MLQALIIVAMSTKPYPDLGRYDSEKYFLNEKQEKCLFPSINDLASVELSVIVPAYNEEERCKYSFIHSFIYIFLFIKDYNFNFFVVPMMMDEALEYLEERKVCVIKYNSLKSTIISRLSKVKLKS